MIRITRLVDQKGMSLVEALVGISMIGVVAASAATLMVNVTDSHAVANDKVSLTNISSSLMNVIMNEAAWSVTKTRNSSMACSRTVPSSCASGHKSEVSLFNSEGKQLTHLNNPDWGFYSNGQPCSTYGSNGCNFKAEIHWEVKCSNTQSCLYPVEEVSIKFSYAGTRSINTALYDIHALSRSSHAMNSSPFSVCATKGMSFVGYGRSIASATGGTYTADQHGCISSLAFQGARGSQGPQGPRGPAGIKGKDGVAYYSGSPPATGGSCAGGTLTLHSPDKKNKCVFSYSSAAYGESTTVKLVGSTFGSGPTVDYWADCRTDGTWNYRALCPNANAMTCVQGSQDVKSPNGKNTCRFDWPMGSSGDVHKVSGTNGGSGSAVCPQDSGHWTLSFKCPDDPKKAGITCPAGQESLPSASGDANKHCVWSFSESAPNKTVTAKQYNKNASGHLSAYCNDKGQWVNVQARCD